MNVSIHRAGLTAASLAVIVTIGGFYVVDGYRAAQRGTAASPAASAGGATLAPNATGAPPPEVVYVRPASAPRVIHVTETAPPVAPKVLRLTVPGVGGEVGDGESDGGGD